MGRPRRLRDLMGVFKDKVSLIKATLLLSAKPTTSSFHLAVLRATTHHPTEPPPQYTLDDVLALGRHHRPTASALVDSILRRLHRTQSAFVALKCLLTLHHILRRGSPVLKSQIPHQNVLNLTTFRDASDSDTLELSKWVRWYAEVIEKCLIVSNSLGFYLCSPPPPNKTQNQEQSFSITNALRELSSLVGMVDQICRGPDSLHYQRISMVFEAMKLVGEDYRITLREISSKTTQLGERVEELSDEELKKLVNDLKRLEECKERAFLMFLNKKKSDGTWDWIAQLTRNVEGVKQRRETRSLVAFQGNGLPRLEGPAAGESRPVMPRGKKWLDVHWNTLVVPNGPA